MIKKIVYYLLLQGTINEAAGHGGRALCACTPI